MILLILAPVLLAIIYGTFLAAPRFSTESSFSVRSSGAQSAAQTNLASLLTTGNGPGASGGFVDGWAVSEFLKSRDCMRLLDQKIGLRGHLSHGGLDLFNRLPTDADEDALYRAYLASIDVSYNVLEQINVLKVSAFSPREAVFISNALLSLAQDFVNKMDAQGISDTLKVSQQAVTLAEGASRDARSKLTEWRMKNGNIDPAAEAAMLLNQVSQIEAELGTAEINLNKIRALRNPDHPLLQPAQMQVEALRRQLHDTRERMSGTGNNTQASRLKAYEALKGAQTVADENLATARQNLQQAKIEALKLQRYLSVIARPVPGERPSWPNMAVLLIEALAVGCALAIASRIGGALYREFRHG